MEEQLTGPGGPIGAVLNESEGGYRLTLYFEDNTEVIPDLTMRPLKDMEAVRSFTNRNFRYNDLREAWMVVIDPALKNVNEEIKLETLITEKVVKDVEEDAPTMSAGSGNIAGIGVGPDGEPGVKKKKKKNKDDEPAGRKLVGTEGIDETPMFDRFIKPRLRNPIVEEKFYVEEGKSDHIHTAELDKNRNGKTSSDKSEDAGPHDHTVKEGKVLAGGTDNHTHPLGKEITAKNKEDHKKMEEATALDLFKNDRSLSLNDKGFGTLDVLLDKSKKQKDTLSKLKARIGLVFGLRDDKEAQKFIKKHLDMKTVKKDLVKEETDGRETFAGSVIFDVDSETFVRSRMGHNRYERWNKFVDEDTDIGRAVKEYSQKNPGVGVILRDNTGAMFYLKRNK